MRGWQGVYRLQCGKRRLRLHHLRRAHRSAKAVSEGCREDFLAIAIAGRGEDYCWPCGSCRQMLYEFAPDLRVLCARGDGAFVETKLSQLLPHGFGPKSLK